MTFLFGTFSFNPASLELARNGRPVRLDPQPARALAVLLASAGEVVSREELRAALWGEHTHVDYDRGLAYCLAQVRTALGDSAENPRFVQTLPKRGFRFLAPVTQGGAGQNGAHDDAALSARPSAPLEAPASAAAPPTSAPAAGRLAGAGWLTGLAAVMALALIWVRADTPPRPAIVAVSIFDNETGDASLDRFVTGLSDVVVTRLTQLAPDRVGVVENSAALRRPRATRNLRTLAEEVPADDIVIGRIAFVRQFSAVQRLTVADPELVLTATRI
jgi:DNA-binding winged helix-turn-helix (wHTH) protein